jgi:hypothetical protein
MYCVQCGTAVQPGQSFCAGCGRPTGSVPLMPSKSRLGGHMRLLAILWFAVSAFRMIPGIAILVIFGSDTGLLPPEVPAFVIPIVQTVGYLFFGAAAIGLIAGWGLLARQPWARTLAIVLGAFSLIDVPFGTALGIYTLWVLLPAQSEEEFKRIANAV